MTSRKTILSTIKKENRKLRKGLPKVDTSQARSNIEVLRMCLEELGWKECISGTSTDSDICWNSAAFTEGNRNFVSTSARVNKFPGMSDLMCKINLTRSLNVMRMLFPDEFDFYPKTWFLPEQSEQFRDDARLIHKNDRKRRRSPTTFIVKPSDGSEGAGIYLIQDPTRCSITTRPHIVQEYIDRPLLINGLKFDMRIYVLIFQLDPLKIYLYDEGLARFATVDYQAPSSKNLHETFMHLTNYSLNKRSVNYKHAVDEKQIDASKRKLSLVWSQLNHLFSPSEIERAKEEIEEIINKTVLAILPELRVQYASELSITRPQNRCFQIIGFDIILTNQLKPILLEVNANPSLRIDFDYVNEAGKAVHEPSLIDEEIKKPLVLETLKLVMNCKRYRHHLDAALVTRAGGGSASAVADNNSTKLLKIIFPSTSQINYEHLVLVERIAFIYIELVVKRGYKAMTSWPFRNLANVCGILDQSTSMSSIDILYTQIIYKCKQFDLQSSATGLQFPAFIEAFFLLSQRKSSTSCALLNSVTELVNSCVRRLDIRFEEPARPLNERSKSKVSLIGL